MKLSMSMIYTRLSGYEREAMLQHDGMTIQGVRFLAGSRTSYSPDYVYVGAASGYFQDPGFSDAMILTSGQNSIICRGADNEDLLNDTLAAFEHYNRAEQQLFECAAKHYPVKDIIQPNGMIVEHLVNSMLQVQEIDSKRELLENKKRLNYLGKLPSSVDVVPMVFNDDGSVTATRSQDKEFERELNEVIDLFEVEIKPLIKYIRDSIFHGKTIKSQELVIQAEKRVLALCDLSSEDSVLEIKTTFGVLPDKYYADQFYYEANGRKCYVLRMDWFGLPKEITFYISEIIFDVKEYIDPILERFENAKKRFETDDIELVSYVDSRSPLRLKCKKCGHEWNTSYWMASEHHPCPNCNPRVRHELSIPKEKAQKPRLTEEENAIRAKVAAEGRLLTFRNKISERSHNNLEIIVFNGSRSPAKVKCLICGHEWDIRSDHLLSRPYCPVCKRNGLWPEK